MNRKRKGEPRAIKAIKAAWTFIKPYVPHDPVHGEDTQRLQIAKAFEAVWDAAYRAGASDEYTEAEKRVAALGRAKQPDGIGLW
jgi:hypothetical protein